MASASISEIREQKQELINKILEYDLYGKNIYLLGTAEFGPTNEPIKIGSTVGLYNNFGKTGSLINAFHAVKYVDPYAEVYLVKTTGKHSECYLNFNIPDGEVINDAFIISASQSNEIFNDVYIDITPEEFIITFPEDLNMPNHELEYFFDDYRNVQELCDAINKDTNNKKSYLYAYTTIDYGTSIKDAFYVCNMDRVYLYGGQAGLDPSKSYLYNCLNRTYDILESCDINIIVPVNAFLDDIYPDDSELQEFKYNQKYYQPLKDYLSEDMSGNKQTFLEPLMNFCIRQLNFGQVTIGIIGFNPDPEPSTYYKEDDYLIDKYIACLEYNLYYCKEPKYKFLIQAVAGDLGYNNSAFYDNGYLAYAGAISKNQIITSMTNFPMGNRIKLVQEFSQKELQMLADCGIVAYRHSAYHNQVCVYSGVSIDTQDKNLRYVCNTRMIQMCLNYLNELFNFYIGLNIIELIEDSIVQNDCDNILKILIDKNIINDYSFVIKPDYPNKTINFELELLTNYMIESVKLKSVFEVDYEDQDE